MSYLNYKTTDTIFREVKRGDVVYLEYPLLADTEIVKHGFSTRIGGVSAGIWSAMNLSFTRGDDPDHVMENFRRIGRAMDIPTEDMVLSAQTHTTNVKVVSKKDRGCGIYFPNPETDIDGMITNEKNVALVTLYADCVPLYFVDPVHQAIGLSHSGWRGTVHRMGQATLDAMKREYGTKPEDVIAAVGPSICQDCYEVSEDVILEFQKNFDKKDWDALFYKKENGKYQLNLWKANEFVFRDAGILPEHMAINNLCTCCNHEQLFSHRASQGKRGNLAAFLELK